MLFFQNVTFFWTFMISLSGLDYNSDNYEKHHKLPPGTFTKEYGSFVITTIISIAAFIFVFILFVQYLLFISTNVSMWEASVSSKITYLQAYPKNFMPFYQGFLKNIYSVFIHNNQIKDWDLPDPNSKEVHQSFNIFNNKYWSCC